jgi:hypothetical protein
MRRPRFSLRSVMAANAAIGLACWQVRTRGSLWSASLHALQYASESPYAWLGGFLIGVGLACLAERHGPHLESRPRWWGLAALVVLAAVYLAWAAIRADAIPIPVYRGWPFPDPAFHAVERVLGYHLARYDVGLAAMVAAVAAGSLLGAVLLPSVLPDRPSHRVALAHPGR